MPREIIATDQAPSAIGTYSQAVKVSSSSTVYISGQVPLHPDTMTIVEGGFDNQVHQVFRNLAAVAAAAGASLADSVKLTVYLTDLGNFAQLNEAMAEYFSGDFPARAAVEVSALPKGAMVEVDAVLVLP